MAEGYGVDFAFLEYDENILAVLLFGSGARGELNERSDRDFCIVAPGLRGRSEKRRVLRKIYEKIDVTGKKIG